MKTVESNRMEMLACLIADLKQENKALTERVKELMNDYNRVAKQLRTSPKLSDLIEAIDKNEELECEKESLCKQLKSLQESNDLLNEQLDAAKAKLQKAEERCEESAKLNKDLQHEHTVLLLKYDTAKSELQKLADERNAIERRYEELKDAHNMRQEHLARIDHSFLVREGSQCRRDAKVNVDSEVCLNCKHCMLSFLSTTDYILCAHDYDKQKEKQ